MTTKLWKISAIIFFASCGGNSDETEISMVGQWTGSVALDKDISCVPTDDSGLDASGNYILNVEPLQADGLQIVTDQNGGRYEQYYKNGIENGELTVLNFDEGLATIPTAISFLPNNGEIATVQVLVFYNRFCTTTFIGKFTKANRN